MSHEAPFHEPSSEELRALSENIGDLPVTLGVIAAAALIGFALLKSAGCLPEGKSGSLDRRQSPPPATAKSR